MKEVISTGIQNLDVALGGGYPLGSVILMMEEPGAGAHVFASHFVAEGLKNSDRILYISTDYTKDEVESNLKEIYRGDTLDNLKILDLFTHRYPHLFQETKLTTKDFLRTGYDPMNYTRVEIERDSYLRIIVNSISYFAINYSDKEVIEFIEFCSMVARQNRSVFLLLMTMGMHDPKIETAIKHEADGIIELKIEEMGNELQRVIKFRKMPSNVVPKSIMRYDLTVEGVRMETLRRVL